MDKYVSAKKLTNQKFKSIRHERGQKLTQRHSDLLDRQRNLTQQNGGSSDIKESDKIQLNVGGTEIIALREILTTIKGSRLEALFCGRWEDSLLRDQKGRVFMDLDSHYFKKIIEHLHLLMETSKSGDEEEVPNWPTLTNKIEQKTLDLYIDLLRLRVDNNEKKRSANQPMVESPNNSNSGRTESYQDSLHAAVKNEVRQLDEAEKNLDKMEEEIKEEEEFVSFFTTSNPPTQAQVSITTNKADSDTDDRC